MYKASARIPVSPQMLAVLQDVIVMKFTLLTIFINIQESKKVRLIIDGRFKKMQNITPEILVGKPGAMSSTIKPLLITRSPTQAVYQADIERGIKFRHRLQLNSSNSGGGPIVSSVRMEEAD